MSLSYSPSAENLPQPFIPSKEKPLIRTIKFRIKKLDGQAKGYWKGVLIRNFAPYGIPPNTITEKTFKFIENLKMSDDTKHTFIKFTITSRVDYQFEIVSHSPDEIKSEKEMDRNLTFDKVISIAQQKKKSKTAKTLSAKVKEVLGTCQSMGCTVDGEPIPIILSRINNGTLMLPNE